MVELREPLDTLIGPPRNFTAGTTFPREKEIREKRALVLGRKESA